MGVCYFGRNKNFRVFHVSFYFGQVEEKLPVTSNRVRLVTAMGKLLFLKTPCFVYNYKYGSNDKSLHTK